MRILHVTQASFAGVLSSSTAIARAQAEVPGVEVTYAWSPRTVSPAPDQIQQMVGPRVRVVRLSRSPRLGVPALGARLPGLIARGDFDVVHLHSSFAGMLGRIAALIAGRRSTVVYSPHSFAFDRPDTSRARRIAYRSLERLGARISSAIIACSPSEQAVARSAIPDARTAILTNAVDARSLAQERRAAQEERTPGVQDGTHEGAPDAPRLRVAHIGRIASQKRPDLFGRIAERFVGGAARAAEAPAGAEGADAPRFTWLGEGDRSLLPPSVEVTGWLTPAQLHRELARTDIVLFTSAAEGMPVSLLEAQAMGIPIVGSRVTGIVDLVDDGRTGLLFTTEDEGHEALRRLLSSPGERRALGRTAAREVAVDFDLDGLAERSFTAYTSLGLPVTTTKGIR
ncbi:glycosyltransferase [Brachybacterium sp. NPDC056505]|uniref:glycosyltransferase n=1 Tax=Brachybacterium sp. NPDC056505 TaxID=3345843 RepID=UPI0036723BFF